MGNKTYNIETFLNDYRKLEDWAHSRFQISNMSDLEYGGYFSLTITQEMRYIRNLRNILTHNPNDVDNPLIILTEGLKQRVDHLYNFLQNSPHTIQEIMIKKPYVQDKKNFILPAISYMHNMLYTHIPIMEGNKLWGVFSDNTFLDLIYYGKINQINNNITFEDIQEFITPQPREGIYDFVSPDTPIEIVHNLFHNAITNDQRLDLLFVTNDGTQNGDLMGLVTVWDLA